LSYPGPSASAERTRRSKARGTSWRSEVNPVKLKNLLTLHPEATGDGVDDELRLVRSGGARRRPPALQHEPHEPTPGVLGQVDVSPAASFRGAWLRPDGGRVRTAGFEGVGPHGCRDGISASMDRRRTRNSSRLAPKAACVRRRAVSRGEGSPVRQTDRRSRPGRRHSSLPRTSRRYPRRTPPRSHPAWLRQPRRRRSRCWSWSEGPRDRCRLPARRRSRAPASPKASDGAPSTLRPETRPSPNRPELLTRAAPKRRPSESRRSRSEAACRPANARSLLRRSSGPRAGSARRARNLF